MINLKDEYMKIYKELQDTLQDINYQKFNDDFGKNKAEVCKLMIEVLEKYSQLS